MSFYNDKNIWGYKEHLKKSCFIQQAVQSAGCTGVAEVQ